MVTIRRLGLANNASKRCCYFVALCFCLAVLLLELDSGCSVFVLASLDAEAPANAANNNANANANANANTANTNANAPKTSFTTAVYDRNWELLETYPHDRASFTQGLEIHPSSVIKRTSAEDDGTVSSDSCPSGTDSQQQQQETLQEEERLLVTESTGNRGESLVRIWDLHTGSVQREIHMDPKFFGEGSTRYVDDKDDGKHKIAVLTYQEESILVYDATTLELLQTIDRWPSPTTTNEGWGIAFDWHQKLFIVTDGSEYLHFWNTDFEEIRPKIPVRLEELVLPLPDGSTRVLLPREDKHDPSGDHLPGQRIGHINELEWDASTHTLLANKWMEEVILRIDPITGAVLRVYDFSALHSRSHREDVFNGIAIIPNTDGKEWLVTGKWWPNMYRIRIQE